MPPPYPFQQSALHPRSRYHASLSPVQSCASLSTVQSSLTTSYPSSFNSVKSAFPFHSQTFSLSMPICFSCFSVQFPLGPHSRMTIIWLAFRIVDQLAFVQWLLLDFPSLISVFDLTTFGQVLPVSEYMLYLWLFHTFFEDLWALWRLLWFIDRCFLFNT